MIINMYIFAIDFDYYEENLSSTISDIMYMYTYTYIGLCTCCKYKVVAMFVAERPWNLGVPPIDLNKKLSYFFPCYRSIKSYSFSF
jgi:hypothetical protein